MDNWLIFQYHQLNVRTEGVTQEDSSSELRFVEAGRLMKLGRKALAEAER